MTQAQYATWAALFMAACIKYSAEVGNMGAIPAIERRMSEHQAVVLAEREKAAPASSRLERLRERVERAGLLG